MATLKSSLKRVIPFLLLTSLVLAGGWIGTPGVSDQAVALADPLDSEASKDEKKSEASVEYQTWQELAYLSVLFKRLAHTYRGMEMEALGPDRYLVPPSGRDPMRWWIEPDPCILDPDTCKWSTGAFGICDSVLTGEIIGVMGRVREGIDRAEEILGSDAPFTFRPTKRWVPGDPWLLEKQEGK